MSFVIWRNKQKLLNRLFNEVIKDLDLPWKNKELDFSSRYRLFLQNYRFYIESRIRLHEKLREEIFINNNLELTVEDAQKFLSI